MDQCLPGKESLSLLLKPETRAQKAWRIVGTSCGSMEEDNHPTQAFLWKPGRLPIPLTQTSLSPPSFLGWSAAA